MRTTKRVLSISLAILLLCASLASCAPQQEKVSELDLIKAEWQQYVVDRTEEIYGAGVGRQLPSQAILIKKDQAETCEILDICQTLNTADLTLLEDFSETRIESDLVVILCMKEPPDTSCFYIYMLRSGEAYLHLKAEEMNYWAHINNWPVYDQLYEYKSTI